MPGSQPTPCGYKGADEGLAPSIPNNALADRSEFVCRGRRPGGKVAPHQAARPESLDAAE